MTLPHFLAIFAAASAGPHAPAAYIDPNTGGMLVALLGSIVAALSGILFFFSRQIKAGLARLRRRLRRDGDQRPPDSGEGDS